MTRITGLSINHAEMLSWTKAFQEQIERHEGWRENLDAMRAESLLEGKEAFTYLLRKRDEENAYYISFVKEGGQVKHQHFTLEHDRKGWFYKNGTWQGPEELAEKTIEALIPQMVHCDLKECKVL